MDWSHENHLWTTETQNKCVSLVSTLVTKPRQRSLQAWQHTPVDLALGRLEVGGSRVQSQPGLHENPFQKQKQNPSNYLLTSAKRSFLFLALVNLTQSDNFYFERRKGRKSDKSISEFSWIGNSLNHFSGLLCWTKEYALDHWHFQERVAATPLPQLCRVLKKPKPKT